MNFGYVTENGVNSKKSILFFPIKYLFPDMEYSVILYANGLEKTI